VQRPQIYFTVNPGLHTAQGFTNSVLLHVDLPVSLMKVKWLNKTCKRTNKHEVL